MRLLITLFCIALCSPPASAAANKPAPVGKGQFCGGFMNVPCEEGLECHLSPPGSTGGECVPISGDGKEPAGSGQMCGGIAGIPCAAGLTCNLTSDNPDAAGVCRGGQGDH
jgi:hypothetical protein